MNRETLNKAAKAAVVATLLLPLMGWASLRGCEALLDAALHEIDQQERQALDLQGRAAWDRYCEDVASGRRQDDLDTTYAECSQFEWEPHEANDPDVADGWAP